MYLLCALLQEIVQLAKDCSSRNEQTWIRTDGPYGVPVSNHRRYPILLLCGGGVGITPIMGMLKDIYNVGQSLSPPSAFDQRHCMRQVFCCWIMRHADETQSFLADIQACADQAKSYPKAFPALEALIYVTRAKADDPAMVLPLRCGRPDFPALFSRIAKDSKCAEANSNGNGKKGKSEAMQVFACGPAPMVTELWDLSLAETLNGRRVDFHKEIFEF